MTSRVRLPHLTFLLAFALVASMAHAQRGPGRYAMNFDALARGSDGAPEVQVFGGGTWKAEKGTFLQTDAKAPYDLGASFPPANRGTYRVSVRIRHESKLEYAGAGLFFNLGDRNTKDFSHMVRFDGAETLLCGTFYRGNFQEQERLLVPLRTDAEAWITLSVESNEAEGTYRVGIDGTWLPEAIPLHYGSGYCALQSSGCVARFDDFEIRLEKDLDRAVRWPNLIATRGLGVAHVDPTDGYLWVSTLDRDEGYTQERLTHRAHGVTALARGPHVGQIFALDAERSEIRRFFRDGGKRPLPLSEEGGVPVDLDVDERGRIHVLWDRGAVVVFDPSGQVLTRTELPRRSEATLYRSLGIADEGPEGEKRTLGVVADRNNGDLFFYRLETDPIVLTVSEGPTGIPDGRDHVLRIEDEGFSLYTTRPGQVVRMRLGKGFESLGQDVFTGGLQREIDPFGMDLGPGGTLAIADRAHQRVLFVPANLRDATPRIEYPEPGKVRVRWTSTLDEHETPRVHVSSEREPRRVPARAEEASGGRERTAVVSDVAPLSRVTFQWDHLGIAIPPAERPYTLEFVTPPGPGLVACARLEVLALVYTNVRKDHDPDEPRVPTMPALTPGERMRIEEELRSGTRFYWINSGMKLWLDLTVRFIDERTSPNALATDGEPNGMPLEEEIARQARELGHEPEDFASICVLQAWRTWDENEKRWRMVGTGGGLTVGPDVRGHGLSWWSVPEHQGANQWLFVHEFHHQLDAMFAELGYGEYWFNHFSPSMGTAARFGEHHDGNAFIARAWPEHLWFALTREVHLDRRTQPFATIVTAQDADGDGFVDDRADWPLDEKRFGSSNERADTDQDGVSDLDEARFQIESWPGGVDETASNFAKHPNPNAADTDGDGTNDAEDRYPLFAVPDSLPKAAPTIDGIVDDDDGTIAILELDDADARATVRGAWNEQGILLQIRTERGTRVKVQLDGHDDGWFVGRENYRLILDDRGATPDFDLYVFNASVANRWPFDDRALVTIKDVPLAHTEDETGITWEFGLPASRATGFQPKAGDAPAFNFAFETERTITHGRRFIAAFEPHRFVSFRLAE
ncbi:MAG: hypothetical protein H6834_16285 [Planctomycetes bacterium]|nr:hypothetical protein [Planctomycetota bacterium]